MAALLTEAALPLAAPRDSLARFLGAAGSPASTLLALLRRGIGDTLLAVAASVPAAVRALIATLPALLRLVPLGSGRLGLGFAPAVGAKIFVPVLPIFAAGLWPLLLAWAGAALLIAAEAWWVHHREACRSGRGYA